MLVQESSFGTNSDANYDAGNTSSPALTCCHAISLDLCTTMTEMFCVHTKQKVHKEPESRACGGVTAQS